MKSAVLFIVVLLGLLVLPVSGQFDPALMGERNTGQDYQFTILNVSGLADVSYNVQVYDYRILDERYSYYSPAWGQWFSEYAAPGKKWLAIWARTESSGTTWYGYGADRFSVWVWDNTTVSPEPVKMQDLPVAYKSDRYLPRVIADLQDLKDRKRSRLSTEYYGWKDENEMDRQEPGPSNAFDGVILYQIPEAAGPDDLRVSGWFGYYGSAVWYLTDRDELVQTERIETAAPVKPVIEKAKPVIRGKIVATPTPTPAPAGSKINWDRPIRGSK